MKIKIIDVDKPQLIDFGRIGSSAMGFITIAEELPFDVKRVYWTYYAPHEVTRGQHAHKNLCQIIFAVSGSIKFELENLAGIKSNFVLESPEWGLYIPKFHWRIMKFSHNAVLLCMASDIFDEEDYIRDYNQFKALKDK